MKQKQFPVITAIVLVLCVLGYAGVHMSGFTNLSEAAIFMQCYYKPFILAGEWWRLLTVGFVHVQLFHFMMNSISLYSLGKGLEPVIGKLKFAVILTASIIGGSLFQFASSDNVVTVGLSGGLYGLLACYSWLLIIHGGMNNPAVRSAMIRTYAVNLLINFMPQVSAAAHLGGFITGLLISALWLPAGNTVRLNKKHFIAASAIFAVGTGWFCVQRAYIPSDEQYMLSDYRVLKKYEEIGLGEYAADTAVRLDTVYGTDILANAMKEG